VSQRAYDGRTLPAPRGPISRLLTEQLRRPPHELPPVRTDGAPGPASLTDEDLQLSLYLCYELHYVGFTEVEAEWEWEPSLLRLRRLLEARFIAGLESLVGSLDSYAGLTVTDALTAITNADHGPSLSRHIAGRVDLEQFREFVIHRSIYHLREADPHTWGIPRLQGPAKAALVEIQADEYGGGRYERMHAELFRTTMSRLGLDTRYRSYIDSVPAVTLALNNTMSLFGLHRAWLGALLGHLAAFEMTSSLSNRRYGNGLRRLGGDATATRFYDEHVEADAIHEQVAANDLCAGYVEDHPDERGRVLFGAVAALATSGLLADHAITRWQAGRTSLRGPAVETRSAA
jgi:hypothetical protein